MDGLYGAGVSVVPDTMECVSDPFHRDPVLYFVAGSGFSLHFKGFNRAPYGDSPSNATQMQVAQVSDPPLPSSQRFLARFLWVLLNRICLDLS